MLSKSYHPLVLTIIGLAIVGLGYQLIVSPGAFITQVLVTAGIVAVLIFVMKRFIMPRIMRNQSPYSQQNTRAHKAAARKQAVSLKSKRKEKKKNRISRPLVKRQSNVKLTVIEGRKNKKKNRALF